MRASRNLDGRADVELLFDVKNYLDVTWEDLDLDEKLRDVLLRGMAYLDRIAGTGLEYRTGSLERGLLLDYVRYVRAGAAQDFGTDFSRELNGLNADMEVMRHEIDCPNF